MECLIYFSDALGIIHMQSEPPTTTNNSCHMSCDIVWLSGWGIWEWIKLKHVRTFLAADAVESKTVSDSKFWVIDLLIWSFKTTHDLDDHKSLQCLQCYASQLRLKSHLQSPYPPPRKSVPNALSKFFYRATENFWFRQPRRLKQSPMVLLLPCIP
jgi:hypothetical protein